MTCKRCFAILLSLMMLWAVVPVAQGESTLWLCPGCSRWNSQTYQFCPYCGTERPEWLQCPRCNFQTSDTSYVYCPLCGATLQAAGTSATAAPTATPQPYILGHTIDRLATRTGPSTDFTGGGAYQVKDQDIPIFSVAYDVNGVTWVQCEISYGGSLRRLYTGLKRFDATTVDLSKIRVESSYTSARQARLLANATLRYGPGAAYGLYQQGAESQTVLVIYVENGWAQIQSTQAETPWRAWVSVNEIFYTDQGSGSLPGFAAGHTA